MRIVPVLSALLVMLVIYLVVLERAALLEFAHGDRSALSRIALVSAVNGTAGDPEATPPPAVEAEPEAEPAPEPAPEPAESASGRIVSVVAQRFDAQEIDRGVILRGRTQAARQVEVRAETSGRVISEPRRRGASVAANDLLCELSPGTRRAALAEAEARLAEASIQFTAADRLSQDGFASEARAAGARAGLQAAEAAVAAAREELSRLEIRAPFGGTLETDTAELGALLQPGALCATVIQLDPIHLVGFVPEADVDKLSTGAPAGARLSSGREVLGTVSFVARAADPATRTFRVEVTVPNSDGTIRDGQTAEIGILASGTRAHLVPGSALTLDDDGRIGLRSVDNDSRARFLPVEVIRDSLDGIWVGGLPESVDVIVVGQEFVRDGVQVVATFRDTPIAGSAPDAGTDLIPDVEVQP